MPSLTFSPLRRSPTLAPIAVLDIERVASAVDKPQAQHGLAQAVARLMAVERTMLQTLAAHLQGVRRWAAAHRFALPPSVRTCRLVNIREPDATLAHDLAEGDAHRLRRLRRWLAHRDARMAHLVSCVREAHLWIGLHGSALPPDLRFGLDETEGCVRVAAMSRAVQFTIDNVLRRTRYDVAHE